MGSEECNDSGLNNPDALFRAHDADNERPEGTSALADGAHESEGIRMHVSWNELAPGCDSSRIEGRDSETNQRGADRRGGEDGDQPCETLEADGEREIDQHCKPLTHEDIERREEDAAQGDTCSTIECSDTLAILWTLHDIPR